jgi:hypothetical protein
MPRGAGAAWRLRKAPRRLLRSRHLVLRRHKRAISSQRLLLLCPIADITQEITGVPMEPHVTHSVFCAEVEMQLFSFSITDLTTFESVPYQEWVEMEDLPDVGKRFARTMLAANPDFRHRGMCVAIYDEAGKAVSVMPLDPLQ